MAFIASLNNKEEEYAFDDLKSAETYLLGRIIEKMEKATSFYPWIYFASGSIKYIKKYFDVQSQYDPDNIDISYGNDFTALKMQTHFNAENALRNGDYKLKERYLKARERILTMLPLQHHEANRNQEFHNNYLNDGYLTGPGRSTYKYSEIDAGPIL